MNDVELGYFKQLSADREESANILEKPSMRGIRRSVVDKYSDRARFVYELIQNADDAGATYANFLLFKDKLVFIHNGTRLFTVTDPSKEAEDSERGTLGDINAITSIANSSKTDASIGKFGVGFKAVFKYTETPYIFDPYVSFKIERFIVPVLIDEECQYKSKKETAFEFPFNHKGIEKEEAYDVTSEMAIEVADYLGMRNSRSELPDNLTDDQADALRIGQMVQKAGVAMEDILAFINAKQKVMAEIDDENLVKEVLGKSDVESTSSDSSLKFDMYASFKYGEGTMVRGERTFSNFTEETVERLMSDVGFTIVECGITSDIRPERAEEKWVNVIVRKG